MKNNTIAVQFYLNEDEEIVSRHAAKFIERVDEYNVIVEVEAEAGKWCEIRRESKDHKGFLHTYEAEKLEQFRDGNEIKYFVSIWNPID